MEPPKTSTALATTVLILAVTPTRKRSVPGAGGWDRLVADGDAEALVDAVPLDVADGELDDADGEEVGPAVGDGVREGLGETVGLGLAELASVGVVAETGRAVSPRPTLTTSVPTVSPARKRPGVIWFGSHFSAYVANRLFARKVKKVFGVCPNNMR